jgi:hypothetical protein
MAGRHKGDTKEFRELSFAEQAKSITAAINNLQAAIEHHVEHSPRRPETIDKCLAQVDRLRQRLVTAYEREGAHPDSGTAILQIEDLPRIRIASPRLADPARATDFTMVVAEVSPDAGLR